MPWVGLPRPSQPCSCTTANISCSQRTTCHPSRPHLPHHLRSVVSIHDHNQVVVDCVPHLVKLHGTALQGAVQEGQPNHGMCWDVRERSSGRVGRHTGDCCWLHPIQPTPGVAWQPFCKAGDSVLSSSPRTGCSGMPISRAICTTRSSCPPATGGPIDAECTSASRPRPGSLLQGRKAWQQRGCTHMLVSSMACGSRPGGCAHHNCCTIICSTGHRTQHPRSVNPHARSGHPPQHSRQQRLRQHRTAAAAVIQEQDAGCGGLPPLAGRLCRVRRRTEHGNQRWPLPLAATAASHLRAAAARLGRCWPFCGRTLTRRVAQPPQATGARWRQGGCPGAKAGWHREPGGAQYGFLQHTWRVGPLSGHAASCAVRTEGATNAPPPSCFPSTQRPTCHRRCSTARGQSQEGPCTCCTWLPETMSYSGLVCGCGCCWGCCWAAPPPLPLLPAAAARRRRGAG